MTSKKLSKVVKMIETVHSFTGPVSEEYSTTLTAANLIIVPAYIFNDLAPWGMRDENGYHTSNYYFQ